MSEDSTESYLKVAYDLRPAKQVERRILLDFFRRLAAYGVPIEDFRYTGMGSIHFVDHILFHKFLGIDKLVSVERDDEIEQRIKFNRPFDNIDLKIMPIGDYVPQLSKDERHIVWLDYDYRLSTEMINDIVSCANCLPKQSFLLITVDTTPHRDSKGAGDNFAEYRAIAGKLWDPTWKASDFVNQRLHMRVIDLVARALREGVAGRVGLSALPCLSFVYSDGHQMVSVGVELGGEEEANSLDKIQKTGADYVVRDFGCTPFYIDVPVLTRKERLHLDGVMPSRDYAKIRSCGLSKDVFDKFGRIYRFFPSYGELLLG